MKELWILSVQTSLPDTCYNHESLNKKFGAFENFADARSAMREEIKTFAFSENAMFDGDGHFLKLRDYIENMYEGEEDDGDDVLNKAILAKVEDILHSVLSGGEAQTDLAEGRYTDWMIEVELAKDHVRFYGVDDGPYNGYNPVLTTNMLSMEEEKDYYFYADDRLGQDADSSELYVDLRKVKVIE